MKTLFYLVFLFSVSSIWAYRSRRCLYLRLIRGYLFNGEVLAGTAGEQCGRPGDIGRAHSHLDHAYRLHFPQSRPPVRLSPGAPGVNAAHHRVQTGHPSLCLLSAHAHTQTHTYIHTYMHPCKHTYIHP